MITTSDTTTRTASWPVLPVAIFALLGLVDLGLLGVIGSRVAPPLAVSLVVAALGLITIVGLVLARNGSRPPFRTAVAARVISGLLAFAAFFAGAPAWIMGIEAFVIVATIAGLVLLRRQVRQRGA